MDVGAEKKPILGRIKARFPNLATRPSVGNVPPISISLPFIHITNWEYMRSFETSERTPTAGYSIRPSNCTCGVSSAEAVAKFILL